MFSTNVKEYLAAEPGEFSFESNVIDENKIIWYQRK